MGKFRDYLEWQKDNELLLEMSISRKNAMISTLAISPKIIEHIVKVLYWEDSVNYNKHITDIDTWLLLINNIELKPNSKKPKVKDFYEWLYDNFYSSERQLDSVINKSLKNYHNLPRTNISQDQLFIILKDIYTKLSQDLYNDKFKSIRDYL